MLGLAGELTNDPCSGTPSHRKRRDVEADESNHGGYGRLVVLRFPSGSNADNGDYVLGDDHETSTKDKDLAAAKSLNDVERNGRRAHIDQCCDELNQERVADGTQALQEHNT